MTMTPEFTRRIAIDAIGAEVSTHSIEASADECAALATRFDLEAIASLSAKADIRRDGPNLYAQGSVDAAVTQNCVVTGEPVYSEIAAVFDLKFMPEGTAPEAEEIELSSDECDIQSYIDGVIDIGEAAAQTLALSLDPFPRSTQAEAALHEAGVISEEEASPFGALKGLRDMLAGKADD